MIKVIKPTEEYFGLNKEKCVKVFLAGGIQGCPDWQGDLVENLHSRAWANQGIPIIIYNPRRDTRFDKDDDDEYEAQVAWEAEHLKSADIIVYWFSKGSVNPITLFEYGMYGLSGNKPIVVGIDKEYEKERSVVMQTLLARPETEINLGGEFFAHDIIDKIIEVNTSKGGISKYF